MVKVTLVRHSVTVANEEGIYDSGSFDSDLSENGVQLALENAANIRPCPDAIFSSGMKRAHQTSQVYALAFAEMFDVEVPIFVKDDLRGQDHGDMEGLDMSSPIFELLLQEGHNGEHDLDAERRQRKALVEVILTAKKMGYENIVVVTHGDVIERCLKAMGDRRYDPRKIRNCQPVGPFDGDAIVKKLAPAGYKPPSPFKPK